MTFVSDLASGNFTPETEPPNVDQVMKDGASAKEAGPDSKQPGPGHGRARKYTS